MHDRDACPGLCHAAETDRAAGARDPGSQLQGGARRHCDGRSGRLGQPHRHPAPRSALAGERAQRRSLREDQRVVLGRRAPLPAGRTRGGRLPELRIHAGAHQRTRRPLFPDTYELGRPFGPLRLVGHRRHDQHHHARTLAQLGAAFAHAHLRRLRRHLRKQHDAQRLLRDRQPPRRTLRLRSEPPPLGLRPRRRRIHRAARHPIAVGRHAHLPAHGSLLPHHGAIPPPERIPPRRRPARPAAPRSAGGRADRPRERRGRPTAARTT